jgi:hypothetical protein
VKMSAKLVASDHLRAHAEPVPSDPSAATEAVVSGREETRASLGQADRRRTSSSRDQARRAPQ